MSLSSTFHLLCRCVSHSYFCYKKLVEHIDKSTKIGLRVDNMNRLGYFSKLFKI
ncbi:hypothetical protein Hanom_Chr17g01552501 [Helianthus anomalus]|nr:hypothetical protein HanIR_Chr17g0865561 [Helianthus annuus]